MQTLLQQTHQILLAGKDIINDKFKLNHMSIMSIPGPSDLDIMKYTPPPLTSPFVLIADNDRVVITQTENDINIISSV